MANTLTPHSKALRSRTAAAYNRKMLDAGKIRQIGLTLATEVANEFDAVLYELGSNRAQGIRALCAFYRKHKALEAAQQEKSQQPTP